MAEACNKCAYFKHQDRQVTAGSDLGACRVNPPSAVAEDKLAFWPVVKPMDWCGSFEAK